MPRAKSPGGNRRYLASFPRPSHLSRTIPVPTAAAQRPLAPVKSRRRSTKIASILHSYPRPPRERVTSNGPIESAPPPAAVFSRSVSGGALPIGI